MIGPFELHKLIFGLALFVVGVCLAFAGRWIFKSVAAVVGCVLGCIVGIGFSLKYGNVFLSLIAGIVGAVIGGLIFHFLVRLGTALACGLIAFMLVYVNFGTTPPLLIIAILVGIGVFAVCFYFIDKIIVAVTALIGGVVCLYAMQFFLPLFFALLIGGFVFIFGVGVQTYFEKGGVSEK